MALYGWTTAQVVVGALHIRWANTGVLDRGYSRPRWVHSEILRYLQAHPLNGLVYSNETTLTYLHNTDTATYCWMPRSHPPGDILSTPAAPGSKERLGRWLEKVPNGTWVMWFNSWWNLKTFDYRAADLRVSLDLEVVAVLADGALFQVTRGSRPAHPYRAAYAALVTSTPAIRSTFDLYRHSTTPTYLKIGRAHV